MADTGLPLNVPYPEPTDLVRDGAAAIQAVAEVLNAPPGAFRYAGTRYFTSSGDFEKSDPLLTGDIGLRAVRVRVQAGGGGGGAVTDIGGSSGGGGGGYAEAFILAASLGTSETVTRGAGGSSGEDGGASSFGSLVAASGGERGAISGAGRGGVGTAGDLLIGGTGGGSGSRDTLGITNNQRMFGGAGGGSHLGGGAEALGPAGSNTNGPDGRLYGGGGAGARRQAAGSNSGGSGAPGIVIVDCFV